VGATFYNIGFRLIFIVFVVGAFNLYFLSVLLAKQRF